MTLYGSSELTRTGTRKFHTAWAEVNGTKIFMPHRTQGDRPMSIRGAAEDTIRKTPARKQDLGEIDWSECPGIERNPKRMSGAWCFEGTRLPVHALFMNLSSGLTIPEFLKMFPAAKEEQIKSVLDFLSDRLEETAGAAASSATAAATPAPGTPPSGGPMR